MEISLSNFRSPETPPETGDNLTIPVFFVADNQLWRGEFHENGHYYAQIRLNSMRVANKTGEIINAFGEHRGPCAIIQGWLYINEIEISQ